MILPAKMDFVRTPPAALYLASIPAFGFPADGFPPFPALAARAGLEAPFRTFVDGCFYDFCALAEHYPPVVPPGWYF